MSSPPYRASNAGTMIFRRSAPAVAARIPHGARPLAVAATKYNMYKWRIRVPSPDLQLTGEIIIHCAVLLIAQTNERYGIRQFQVRMSDASTTIPCATHHCAGELRRHSLLRRSSISPRLCDGYTRHYRVLGPTLFFPFRKMFVRSKGGRHVAENPIR